MRSNCLALLFGYIVAVTAQDYANNTIIQLFQEYIQIDTTSNGNLTPAVEFWQKLAAEEGHTINVYEFYEGYPVVVIRVPGTNSSLSSIMLNSHMDVVPANQSDGWTYPPFSATLDDEGVIWGRGTQDCKSIAIQYWEALKNIKANGTQLLRDVYITLMPDEEIGGDHGMVPLVASENFTAMNVGFGMDEGGPYNINGSLLLYRDKAVWSVQFDCYGVAGHGSFMPPINTTAIGQCVNLITILDAFREEQYPTYLSSNISTSGLYTSLNLGIIDGGTAFNVIPGHVSMLFDMRLNGSLDEDIFEAQLNEWVKEAGDNITITFHLKGAQTPATITNDSNPYWTATIAAANKVGITMVPTMPPGATDSRYLRAAGIPAFGFSPMPNTASYVHAVNERLSAPTFLQGIKVYEALIQELANIPAESVSDDPSVYVVK